MSATRVPAPTCPVSSCHALHLNRLDTDVQVAKWRSLVAFLRQSRATCHVTRVCVCVRTELFMLHFRLETLCISSPYSALSCNWSRCW